MTSGLPVVSGREVIRVLEVKALREQREILKRSRGLVSPGDQLRSLAHIRVREPSRLPIRGSRRSGWEPDP